MAAELKKHKVPERTCIGCRNKKPKGEMVRIAFYEGELSVDRKGKAKGRGVYICNDPECRAEAKKKNALQRSFRTGFDKETIDKIFEELEKND